MRAKLVIISDDLPGLGTGGAGTVALRWWEALREEYEINYVVTGTQVFLWNGDDWVFHANDPAAWCASQYNIRCWLFLHLWRVPDLVVRAACKAPGLNIFRFGDEWPVKQGRIALVAAHAHHTIVNSTALLPMVDAIAPGRSVVLVPNWVDVPSARPKLPDFDYLRCLFLGRLVVHKGGDTIIAALAQCKSDVTLGIAGQGRRDAEWRQQVCSSGLADRVHFLGFVSRKETAELMRAAHVVVFPSRPRTTHTIEGLPNTILEAWAQGRPVLGNFLDGLGSYVRPGVDSIAVNAQDPRAWALALKALRARPAWIEALSEGAYRRAHEFHKAAGEECCRKAVSAALVGLPSQPKRGVATSSRYGREDAIAYLQLILRFGLEHGLELSRALAPNWRHRDPAPIQAAERLLIGGAILAALGQADLLEQCQIAFENEPRPKRRHSMVGSSIAFAAMILGEQFPLSQNWLDLLYQGADGQSPDNNHLLFHLAQSACLTARGVRPWKRSDENRLQRVLSWITSEGQWEGWFRDGIYASYDHYNSWGYYLYLPLLTQTLNRKDVYDRLRPWAAAFLSRYIRLLNPRTGMPVLWGRSLSYRMGVYAGIASILRLYPDLLADNDQRRVRRYFLANLGTYSRTIGAYGVFFPGLTGIMPMEQYASIGTPLWGLTGFLMLLLQGPWPTVSLPLDSRTSPSAQVAGPLTFTGNLRKLDNAWLYNSPLYTNDIRAIGIPGDNPYWPGMPQDRS